MWAVGIMGRQLLHGVHKLKICFCEMWDLNLFNYSMTVICQWLVHWCSMIVFDVCCHKLICYTQVWVFSILWSLDLWLFRPILITSEYLLKSLCQSVSMKYLKDIEYIFMKCIKMCQLIPIFIEIYNIRHIMWRHTCNPVCWEISRLLWIP